MSYPPIFHGTLVQSDLPLYVHLGERKRESQILAKLADRAIFFGDGLRY